MTLINPQDIHTIKKLDMRAPYVWLATWFGAGFMRPGPGTWGSLMALPPGLIIYGFFGLEALGAATALVALAGLWAGQAFDKATGGHDHKMIVIDEVAGQWLTLLPALYFFGMNVVYIGLAFGFFRLFDIFKPWPISWLERHIKGTPGVMVDDIAAGMIAGLCLWGVHYAGFG